MSEIRADDMPLLMLRMVPESAEFIAEKYGMPADHAVVTRDAMLDLYDLLTEAFMDPILLPQLRSSAPDTELLQRCFDLVERLMESPDESLRGAVYFQVLEQFLNPGTLIEDSFPYMRERTRKRTVMMLKGYGITLPGITDV
ncbi:hypothetical protein OG883_03670 [Streptomyces sp. NBC_01142]|uniref:hypothetical protein n=1 Tax=Streptomyces sp. NBC_01142 TaxID=2975865 RepID=UPI0022521F0C|nr:hypothetical protein [Streptomyces sp. NBC_01142]MCX4819016.1 hypothetical protein [Streptomyces sp. NBC_01142]